MEKRHHLTIYTLIISAAGLAVNLALSKLMLYFSIPLYLDSVGTILAAILGGYLPGIIVGFFSNVINSLEDPITLYYAVVNILIACAAAFLADRDWFAKPGKAALAVLVFAFIGGGLGSGLTWLLYGFNFGTGITAPFAIALYEKLGLSIFLAQLTADFGIDVADKLITVIICYITIRLLPQDLMIKLSFRRACADAPLENALNVRLYHVRHSLRSKVVSLIAVTALILSGTATTIGYTLYTGTMTGHYENTATTVAEMSTQIPDGDSIEGYLATLEETDEYKKQESALKALRDCVPDVEYIYVYQIRADGCHVVFDVDTPELPGGSLGDVLPVEEQFQPYLETLLAGGTIPPVVSSGAYGWLLTAYAPIRDSSGATVAYAAADISMDDIVRDMAVFVIKMAALLFGVSIVIIAFALWFAERQLVDPINAMAEAADDFAYDNEKERVETTANLQALNIRTGDEIENLYGALKKTVTDVSKYITDISEKNEIISRMQHNIIISFANMVENRDLNTGRHIKRTAAYVNVIALELYREGKYPDVIDPGFISSISQNAPLHDLGKIEVSDSILNKPGRLTPEEFEQMKHHTTAGKKILLEIMGDNKEMDYLHEAVNMAAYHHERWDGTGYPERLRGEDIPVSARIMAVADVYDALISKRSYKEPMTADKAVGIIREESGTHFDPVVVDAFLKARDAIDEQTRKIE